MVDFKQLGRILGLVISLLAPYLIDKANPLSKNMFIGLYIFIGIVWLILAYNFWIKDLLTKEKERKRELSNEEGIEMFKRLKRNPFYGAVDNYIERIDHRLLSVGEKGSRTKYLAVQGKGNFYKKYCFLLVNIFDKTDFSLSEESLEKYSWDYIKKVASEMPSEKEEIFTKKVIKRDPDTGEATVEIEETSPTLPYLPAKNEGATLV